MQLNKLYVAIEKGDSHCQMIMMCLVDLFMILKTLRNLHKGLTYKFSSNNRAQMDFVYGINPVEAALHAGRRSLYKLYLSDSDHI